MLGRLNRETQHHHAVADNDRLAMLSASATPTLYASCLSRVHGFEAPLEAALLMTDSVEQWLDLRDRSHLKLLRSDLRALGIGDPNQLPRCSTVFPFRHPAEALGWIYVVERNTLLHGVIERGLRNFMPEVLKSAGSYLSCHQRSTGQRLRDLGMAMDRIAKDGMCAERIVSAARTAFRAQHGWYDVAIPPRQRVA
jgi:heme oxygenase